MRRVCRPPIIAAVILAAASNVWAQSERLRVSGGVAGALGDGGPAPAVSVAGGFQLVPRVGLELELLYVHGQDFGETVAIPLIFPPIAGRRVEVTGHTLAFLSSFVANLEVGRLRPYAVFGGGIASVTRETRVIQSGFSGNAGSGPPALSAAAVENGLALTAGAGLEIRAWRALFVAADVRYLHLSGNSRSFGRIDHLTRVGGRVGYSF